MRASADWLLLLRCMCLFEEGTRLVLGVGWPAAWFATPGELRVQAAPTRFGPLDLALAWPGAGAVTLTLTMPTPPPGGYELWLPFPVDRVLVDEAGPAEWASLPAAPGLQGRSAIRLPATAHSVRVHTEG